ncbi:MAG: alpha-ketoacid dehydrogenase subunit beta [Betaproteobacteria bacterium]|nr:alpha-ketoacid dehydrogenase subunit beta [Betaproteobacteria bacterium]
MQKKLRGVFMLKVYTRELSYTQAICEALDQAMHQDPKVIVIGEGVPDPKAIFHSTKGLQETHGKNRVFDMPLSENGMTGICIGAALTGMRPVLVHQRLDFALLSMDQLVNNAAKWSYMFNGQSSVPLVVRMIVGRGWGQGPQHSQSLQAMFAQVPGLKVVMPTTPYDAKGMMIAAIEDPNPVLFIEHRWLHNIKDQVPEMMYRVPLDRAQCRLTGQHVTVAAFSYANFDALLAAKTLLSEFNIEIELLDMCSVRPLDTNSVIQSVRKTGHLVVTDTAQKTGSISGELITEVLQATFGQLKKAPTRVCLPDYPAPSAPSMTEHYYPTALNLVEAVLAQLDVQPSPTQQLSMQQSLLRQGRHDVPHLNFVGPF